MWDTVITRVIFRLCCFVSVHLLLTFLLATLPPLALLGRGQERPLLSRRRGTNIPHRSLALPLGSFLAAERVGVLAPGRERLRLGGGS